jgi:Porin subfamily
MRENLEVTMNMVKSLLLGSAAGLVAVAGAQAADLPVKAKPVEYVKVCSAYGAGFYYIPGTDICLRVGGYVWSEFEVNDLGAGALNTSAGAIGGDFIRNRADNWTSFRTRFDMVFDARTNTEYGTLRSYASVGWQWTTNLDGFQQQQLPASTGNYAWYYDRAFIQFAGLTFGYVGSFFDFDPSLILSQQTSKSFKFSPAIAYTAQLGSGISASLSMEDSTTRRTHIQFAGVNGGIVSTGYYSPSTTIINGANNIMVVPILISDSGWAANFYSGQYMPDFIANLRVDQAWGDAQISGAIHQVKATIAGAGTTMANGLGAQVGVTTGIPLAPVKYGYAALGGVNMKLPMLGAGDSFQVEGAWARGAVDYTGTSANPYSNNVAMGYRQGAVGPVIDLFDSYIDTNGQHLSTAYSINVELRHFWTPTVRSSIAYGYNKFKSPAAAQTAAGAVVANDDIGFFPSGKINQVSANLIWSPVPKLDLGVEAVWIKFQTDCGGETAAACAAGTQLTRGKTSDTVGGVFRARRDF